MEIIILMLVQGSRVFRAWLYNLLIVFQYHIIHYDLYIGDIFYYFDHHLHVYMYITKTKSKR